MSTTVQSDIAYCVPRSSLRNSLLLPSDKLLVCVQQRLSSASSTVILLPWPLLARTAAATAADQADTIPVALA